MNKPTIKTKAIGLVSLLMFMNLVDIILIEMPNDIIKNKRIIGYYNQNTPLAFVLACIVHKK